MGCSILHSALKFGGCSYNQIRRVEPLQQVSVWNGAVLRGDLNNITIGQVSNIQDRTVVHAARWDKTVPMLNHHVS